MKNIQNRPDRRSVRTKKAIINALTTLMGEKEISKITIKEIAEQADINRKTFYAHYGSVHEVLDEIENSIIEYLTEAVDTIDLTKGQYDPYSFFEKIMASSYMNFDIYEHLMKAKERRTLLAKIQSVLKERIINSFSGVTGLDKAALSYAIEYISAGTISVYELWFNSDRSKSLEEVSRFVQELTFEGLKKLIDIKTP